MHEFLCLITKFNTTFHELSKSYMIDAILSQIEGENSKYIFGPSSSVMTVVSALSTQSLTIAEAPLMSGLNKGNIAFKLYEAQIIPCLLHNSESWIGMTKKHLEVLQKFQDQFVRKVLRIPLSTPKAIMQYDTGLWSMDWRMKY